MMQTSFILPLVLALALQGGSCRKQPHMKNNTNTSTEHSVASPMPTPAATPVTARVATGLWGGQHVRLEVTATGASIEFDCGHGTLDAPLTLQAGRFDVAGTYVREGGATRGGSEKGRSARFKGQVEGARMTLTFALDGTDDTTDSFSLLHGAEARLVKCK